MEQAAEWFSLLVSDDATAEDRSEWQRWLAAHPDHRRAWSYVEKVSQRIVAPLKSSPDPRLTTANLHAANQRMMRRRRVLRSIATLTGTGVLGWTTWHDTPLSGLARAYAADYRSNTGEIKEVALADGTHVWLDTATAFNQDYQPSLRRLSLLRGEILVTTAAAHNRPFVVDTQQGRLRALGTQFTVQQQDGLTLLAVYQGAVEIRTAGNDEICIVPAGRQTCFSADSIQPLTAADPARQAWSRGQLLVLNLTLAEVVAELRRYTVQHIGVAPALTERRVFGTFPLRDVQTTLALLAEAAHAQVHRPLPWWNTLVTDTI